MVLHGINFDPQQIQRLCRRARVARAWLFGSVLTDQFGPGSDIDVLVESDSTNPPGLLTLGGLQMDLSELLGHRVHLTLLAGVPGSERPGVLARARMLDAA